MGLFSPKWKSRNEEKALAFTEQETNQETLSRIAENAPLPRVRSAAVRKLDSLSRLVILSRTETDSTVLQAFAERLHNQSGLIALFKNRMESTLNQRQALQYIEDGKLLIRIIRESYDSEICRLAAKKITDPKDAVELLLQRHGNETEEILFSLLKDPEDLAELALHASDRDLRIRAAGCLSDPENLSKVLLHTHEPDIAKALLPKITGEDSILLIARQANSSRVRVLAASVLTDETKAAELILENPVVFDSLLEKIQSPELLLRMERDTTDRALLNLIYNRQGVFVCISCGSKSPATDCICRFCGAENHRFVHRKDVREYRDYSSGSEWEECTRCGQKRNLQSVYTEYLE